MINLIRRTLHNTELIHNPFSKEKVKMKAQDPSTLEIRRVGVK